MEAINNYFRILPFKDEYVLKLVDKSKNEYKMHARNKFIRWNIQDAA